MRPIRSASTARRPTRPVRITAYTPEQLAYDNGKNDLFPLDTGNGTAGGAGAFGTKGQVMGYFDGNTVTAYWNYAQNYAMSDNAFTDDFGPSTPGAHQHVRRHHQRRGDSGGFPRAPLRTGRAA